MLEQSLNVFPRRRLKLCPSATLQKGFTDMRLKLICFPCGSNLALRVTLILYVMVVIYRY